MMIAKDRNYCSSGFNDVEEKTRFAMLCETKQILDEIASKDPV